VFKLPNLYVNQNPVVHVSENGDAVVTVHEQDVAIQMLGTTPGPPGTGGGTGLGSYVHDQTIPSSSWNITHSLGFFPNVLVIDSGGSQCFGTVTYPSINALLIVFSASFAGKAYLS
jgi:hypothetical protein